MADAGVARGSGLLSFTLAATFPSLWHASVFLLFSRPVLLRLGLCVVITAELVGGC